MAKIVDPDALNQSTEIIFDTTGKTIQLLIAGNLDDDSPGSASGVTLQAVYSFCKEEWKTDAILNKFRFPFDAITAAKMDLVNGWDWEDQQTIDLIRDGGWSLRDSGGTSQEEYMCIISLGGSFVESSDKAYYQGDVGFDQSVTIFDKTDSLNEPVKVYGDVTHGDFDNRDFFKIYLREQAKTYAGGSLLVDQNLSVLDYTVYKLPLVNAVDIKITASDLTVDTTEPYVGASNGVGFDGSVTMDDPTFTLTSASITFVIGDVGKIITIISGNNTGRYEIATFTDASNVDVDRNFSATEGLIGFNRRVKGMTVDYVKGSSFTTWTSGGGYAVDTVTLDNVVATPRWFRAIVLHSGETVNPSSDTTNWAAYPGEKQIGDNYYAFNRIVNANNGDLEKVYEFTQRQLRQPISINDCLISGNAVTVYGNVAVPLAGFLGDTLQTNPGTLVNGFDINDKNRIQMFDITVDGGGLNAEGVPVTTTQRDYPFVAAGTIVFNQALIDDPDAEFTMYFTNDDAGEDAGCDFDTTSGIIVQDSDTVDIKAEAISGNVTFSYDYDGNVQRGSGSAGVNAPVTIVAMGLDGAQWVVAPFTITKAVGLNFPVNAAKERNYNNPT